MFNVTTDGDYRDQIRQFFQSEFPNSAVKSSGDTLELLTEAILASGQIRLGPRPGVESLFEIRKHLKAVIDSNEPVRFLMPWGSEKPVDLQTVDVAEIVAMKTLACLQGRVESIYRPGISIRIRIEDATAPNLYFNDRPRARLNAQVYTDSLIDLIHTLEVQHFITPVPETQMTSEDAFEREFEQVYPTLLDYVKASEGVHDSERTVMKQYSALKELGWMGTIADDQRTHYRDTYRKLYGSSDNEATELFARYLAQSLVRKRINILGNGDWTDYLGLSFVRSVPGEPLGRTNRRIYYRTMPANVSSNHIPPWRAKGYLVVNENGVRPRLASWQEQKDYVPNVVRLSNGEHNVNVRADYEVS
jgi:hypothetical protein